MRHLTDREFTTIEMLIRECIKEHKEDKNISLATFKAWLEVHFTVQLITET
jgi:hypothetical protein